MALKFETDQHEHWGCTSVAFVTSGYAIPMCPFSRISLFVDVFMNNQLLIKGSCVCSINFADALDVVASNYGIALKSMLTFG